ncbi:MAG: helix-hairpin-helix domain-containing protein [Xanthomonadaceae bacterium]|nr:helix-hairpin-helix domain-containing protein [Xanthomonadaceae bacterium]MDE3071527.1 helix-hairpin-helix domain-containing protein [Pseudomonadota bacterium]
MSRKLAALVSALILGMPGWSFAATPVNINTADAATIARSLDGVGPSRAQAIVAWRDAHGPFKKVADLARIKGLGKGTLERNRAAILLADDAAARTSPPAGTRKQPRHKAVAGE